MDISCPSFEVMSSTTDGGYSSHNTSQEDDTMSFCFRDWKGLSFPLLSSAGNTISLRQNPLLPLDPTLTEHILGTLAKPVKDMAIFSKSLMIALTEDGIFGVDTLTASKYNGGKLFLGGSFFGLAVWAVDSDCPLILTSAISKEFASLVIIDISGDIHCQMIPISTIPSDLLPFSQINSISVDDRSNNAYLSDGGLQKVTRINLMDYSCGQFCNFAQNYEVVGCLAMPTKVIVSVKYNDNNILHIFNSNLPSVNYQQHLKGDKMHKLGLFRKGPVVLMDDKIEEINVDI